MLSPVVDAAQCRELVWNFVVSYWKLYGAHVHHLDIRIL